MAKMIVTSENQIQRLNNIMVRVAQLRHLDAEKRSTRPAPKAWAIIEIIEHLNKAYALYEDKIESTLRSLPDMNHENKPFKIRPWQGFVINGTKPKGQKRKWKIKTLKRFEPHLKVDHLSDETSEAVFNRFEKLHLQLKSAILESRSKDVSKLKISSAIGTVVMFYLPECFEFLLVHMERHMLQVEDVSKKLKYTISH